MFGGIYLKHNNMDIKFNDATFNRPDGERILDAPFLTNDIDKYHELLTGEEAWQKNDRNGITIYKTDRLTHVLTCLKEDASIESNSVNGLITIQVIKGSVNFILPGNEFKLGKRQMVTIHAGVEHSLKANKETLLLISTVF
jgi:quercetin dioxygenase-like cupin family protein